MAPMGATSAEVPGMGSGPYGLVETHISVLLFTGEHVYKLKKPVSFDFVDFSTRLDRERACHHEVAMNRRIAPDVYLGVVDVHGPDGSVMDHMVMMRAMPSSSSLAALVAAGDPSIPERLEAIAELIHEFHEGAERGPQMDTCATRDVVLARWGEGFAEVSPYVGSILDEADEVRVEHLVREYLAGREQLFAHRITTGCIGDGHGDLQAADVFCLEDGPRVLDCIEFDDQLRYGDFWGDIAFLVMDLERLGDPVAADLLVTCYGSHRDDRPPDSLLHHYIAMKAHIRAKVAALRAAQSDEGSELFGDACAQAAELLELTRSHLEAGRVRLVIVGGSPGTGKSTLAAALGADTGVVVLRSDEIRKESAGLAGTDRVVEEAFSGLYGHDVTDATYVEMFARARRALVMGESVVLDASFTSSAHRDAARALAHETSSAMVELRCVVSPEIAARRIAGRLAAGGDPSDATPEIARVLAASADPWPEASEVSTDAPPGEVLATALELSGLPRQRVGA